MSPKITGSSDHQLPIIVPAWIGWAAGITIFFSLLTLVITVGLMNIPWENWQGLSRTFLVIQVVLCIGSMVMAFTAHKYKATLIQLCLPTIGIGVPIIAVLIYPLIMQSMVPPGRKETCHSNQRQISAAITMWIQDHEETLPSSSTIWSDLLDRQNRHAIDQAILICPTLGKHIAYGYGFNSNLSGMAIGKIDQFERALVIADCKPSSPLQNILLTPQDIDLRHTGKANATYLDGHVGTVDLNNKQNALTVMRNR